MSDHAPSPEGKRPSVLFVNQHYHPDIASTGQHLTDLAEYLVERGHAVDVLTGRVHYLAGNVSAPATELRARLAMLRHRTGSGDGAITRLGPISLDTEGYRATASGRPLDLTYKEFELLRFLAARPGRVSTRPALLREVWGYDFYGGTRTVDVHVRRLRSKLGPEHEHLIETVRSVGYRAAEQGD